MGNIELFTIASVVALTLAAVMATVAHASPKLAGAPSAFEASGGVGKIQGVTLGETISCEKSTAKGEVSTGGEGGTSTTRWTGCSTGGVKCKSVAEGNGLEAATGEVGYKAVWHLTLIFTPIVLEDEIRKLELVELIRLKCGVATVIVRSGNGGVLLSTSLEDGVSTTSMKLEGKALEGKQEDRTCEEPVGLCSSSPIELLIEFAEGKTESAVLTETEEVLFNKSVTPEG